MYNLDTPGKRVRTLRTAAGLEQAQLAKAINVTQATISYIENGQQRMTLDAALKLAKPLNTNPQYLLMLTDVFAPEVICVPV